MADVLELILHPEGIVALLAFALSVLLAYLMLPLVRDPVRARRRLPPAATAVRFSHRIAGQPQEAPAGGAALLGLEGQLARLSLHVETGLRAARTATSCHRAADLHLAAAEQDLHRLLGDLRAIGMSFAAGGAASPSGEIALAA